MIDRSQIREHMDVMTSDGSRLGAVDSIDGDRIKLTRKDSPDGQHYYVSLADVERVDAHVHLRSGHSAVFWAAAAGATGAAAAGAAPTAAVAGSSDKDGAASPLIKNPAVGTARARTVIQALGARGVDTTKLAARTGGENDPVRNDSQAGKAANRRTEFMVLSR